MSDGPRSLSDHFQDLRFGRTATEADLRRAICSAAALLYRAGLIASNDGNISVRLPDVKLLITPAGRPKAGVKPAELVVVDPEGRPVDGGARAGKVSSEIALHVETYRRRPDVGAVVHAHPPHATALTVAGISFPDDVLAEIPMTIGRVPTVDFTPPASVESARAIGPHIAAHDALLLKNHGSLTVGRDLEAALIALERIESVARIYLLALGAGRIERLPEAFLESLSDRRTYGAE